MVRLRTIERRGIELLGVVVVIAFGLGLFWAVPEFTSLGLGNVVLVILLVIVGTVMVHRISRRLIPTYNVAEVEVKNVITRDGSPGPVPIGRVGASANEIVEQIERADADGHANALIVKLNTPGGQVVPSEDIRQAVAAFDGPTVAYAEDIAASGGYWIACGSDEIHARRGSIVGSIGVNGIQLGRAGLRDKIGLEYRRFVAGEFKDAGSPWRELGDEEVSYLQGLLDSYYEQFVETVVDGTDLDAAAVEATEARLYHGEAAVEIGLVDACGPREEMESRLAERLGVPEIVVKSFEPTPRPSVRLQRGMQSVAHAFGAGIASTVLDTDEPSVRI